MGVADFEYDFYFLAIAKLLHDQYFRLLDFYFHTLIQQRLRSLYYVAKAISRGENSDVVSYLAERAKLFGLIKAERQRHREKEALHR